MYNNGVKECKNFGVSKTLLLKNFSVKKVKKKSQKKCKNFGINKFKVKSSKRN